MASRVEWGLRQEVFCDNLVLHVREPYVVVLADHVCSCGKWDKSGIPCQHTMASIPFSGANPLDYVSKWFKKTSTLKPANLFLIQ